MTATCVRHGVTKLELLRLRRGLSQAQLARRVGVCARTVLNHERRLERTGRRASSSLPAMAAALGWTDDPRALLDEVDVPASVPATSTAYPQTAVRLAHLTRVLTLGPGAPHDVVEAARRDVVDALAHEHYGRELSAHWLSKRPHETALLAAVILSEETPA